MISVFHFDLNILRAVETQIVGGALNDTDIAMLAPVPITELWYIHHAMLQSTDGTARNGHLFIERPGARVFIEGAPTASANISINTSIMTRRPILLFPGYSLGGQVNALTAGAALDLLFHFSRLQLPRQPISPDMPWVPPNVMNIGG